MRRFEQEFESYVSVVAENNVDCVLAGEAGVEDG